MNLQEYLNQIFFSVEQLEIASYKQLIAEL